MVTDFATAELVKVAANAFLATKISFINAMAEVCEASGADVTQLARAIGYDARIGNKFLRAGIGFGGACLPKDIRAFQARAQELGAGEALRFLHEVDLINQRRRTRVVQLAAELLDRPYGPAGPDLTGAAHRRARRHVQAQLRRRTRLAGRWRSPASWPGPAPTCPSSTRRAWRTPRRELPEVTYAASLADAVTGADLVCVLTEWEEFRYADPHALGELVNGQRSSTAATASTRHCGRPPAGRSAAWAAPPTPDGPPPPHRRSWTQFATRRRPGPKFMIGRPGG